MDDIAKTIPTLQQPAPPAYSEKILGVKKPINKRCWYGLIVFSCLVSGALITLGIVGGLHVKKQDKIIDEYKASQQNSSWEAYRDDLYINPGQNKELVRYGNNSIMLIDFTNRRTGIYDAPSNCCYLIGEVDDNIADARELAAGTEDGDEDDEDDNTDMDDDGSEITDKNYDSNTPITDLALLPEELQGVCWGKKSYWAERMPQSQSQALVSRGGCFYYRRRTTVVWCCRRGWWRCKTYCSKTTTVTIWHCW